MGGFRNSILGGINLIRAAIQSPNFVSGSTGWKVGQDGSAEFNNVVIRGGTVVSGLALYYDGTPAAGNLIMSIAAAAGTDAYGNAYVEGTAVYDADGSQLQIVSGAGASMVLTPADLVGTTWYTALFTTVTGASNRPGVQLTSPATTVHNQAASLTMYGGGPTTSDTSVFLGADRVSLSGDLQIPTGEIDTYAPFGTWNPTVTNGGVVTWTTKSGAYMRIGKLWFVQIYLAVNAAGSGAGIVTVDVPFTVDRTMRQILPMHTESVGPAGSHIGNGAAVFFTGGTGGVADRLRTSSNGATNADANLTGADLLAAGTITIQGWLREA
jgi:hypothetical protein